MSDRIRRMNRMLDRQPPHIAEEIALRVIAEIAALELAAEPSPYGELLRQRVA